MVVTKAFFIITLCNLFQARAQTFHGYDCTTTSRTRLIPYEQDGTPCMDVGITEDDAKKVNATIIQDEGEEHHFGYKCSLLETRQVTTCGWYSHTTPMLRLSHANRKIPVSAEQCMQARLDKLFISKDGYAFPVKSHGTTIFNSDIVGSSYLSSGYAYCDGGTYDYQNETVYSAVVNLELRLTIEEISVKAKGSGIVEEKENVMLQCSITDENCEYNLERLIWHRPHRICTAAQARHFTGIILSENGNTTITAVDKSMVYLTLGKVTEKCGIKVRKTQFEDITVLIHKEGQNKTYPMFNKPITANAGEMAEFVEDRDAFMVHQLKKYIDFEDKKAQHKQCLMDHQFNRMIPILSGPARAYQQTWRIRDNIFARHAGQAYYVFECKLTQVKARETDQCYEELPVTDLFQFGKEWFLKAETGELVAQGTPRPCAEYMHKVIKSIEGTWVQLTPTPAVGLTPDSWAPHRLTWKLIESVAGGIFSQREMHEASESSDKRTQHVSNGRPRHDIADNQYNSKNIKYRGNWLSRQEQYLEEDVEAVAQPVAAWFSNLWKETQYIFYGVIVVLVLLIMTCACIRCRCYKWCTYYGPQRPKRTGYSRAQTEEPPIVRRSARQDAPRIVELDEACADAWEQATQLNRVANPNRALVLAPSRRQQPSMTLTPY